MYIEQQKRFFPMPQYDLSNPGKVKLRIIGKVLDENYTRILYERTDLSLETVIYLDKVQKKEKLARDEAKKLKKQNLVEGRYPNLYVSSGVAAVTEDKSLYIKHRAFDNTHYKKMIISFIKKFGAASRQDIDKLLLDKLSDVLNEKQKLKKINNLLNEMVSKDQTIKNIGSKRKSKWTSTDSL